MCQWERMKQDQAVNVRRKGSEQRLRGTAGADLPSSRLRASRKSAKGCRRHEDCDSQLWP